MNYPDQNTIGKLITNNSNILLSLPHINIEYLPVIVIFLECNFTNENTNTHLKMIYFCQKGDYKITKRKRFLSIFTEPTIFTKSICT